MVKPFPRSQSLAVSGLVQDPHRPVVCASWGDILGEHFLGERQVYRWCISRSYPDLHKEGSR